MDNLERDESGYNEALSDKQASVLLLCLFAVLYVRNVLLNQYIQFYRKFII